MSHTIHLSDSTDKTERYKELLPQIQAVVSVETDWVAVWAHTVAMLRQAFSFFWVGFYRVEEKQLTIAPYQGALCCSTIPYGKGVCGTAWKEAKTIIVPDVDKFPGHIACSSLSRSEIVVPLIKAGKVIAVLDIDCDQLDQFDSTDALYLEQLTAFLATLPTP